ncbi:MAG TPA: preprotein translocase subunit SecG [Armatimonadota bacterium]|jgi:protein translocase SecG subunit
MNNAIHILLQIFQALLAIGLIWIVMSQTGKDQGMGATMGGADQSGSRFKGGYEEMLDAWAFRFAGLFLVVSFLVAVVAHYTR